MERLTNIGTNGEIYISDMDETRRYGQKETAYKRLKMYEDEDEQQLLIHLICKVGTKVYVFLPNDNHYTECQVNKIEIKPTLYGNICYYVEPIGNRGCLYKYFENDFNKTLFLNENSANNKKIELEV